MKKQITTEMVNAFLNGSDPMEHIITIECGYMDDKVSIIYVNDKGEKRIKKDGFKPFVWIKNSACVRMFEGNRGTLRRKMKEYGINVKALITKEDDSKTNERLENGYKYMFYATKPMTYQRFLMFFNEAGTPIYDKKAEETNGRSTEFMAVTPIEQYMIQTGKRLFKGYENYDDLKRMMFDLETEGLNPEIHAIDQIGIRTNKGFERVISIKGEGKEKRMNELKAIHEFISIIAQEKPDIIAGHNSENFDWNFIIVRCQKLGTTLEEISTRYLPFPIYKKKREAILKLGGEMEYYKPTVAWGFSLLDSLHAVRRAQALDSNMKSANLKYTTKYLNLNKPNRVYVPGNKISTIWNITDEIYAFNDTNGDWYEITAENSLKEGYEPKSGKYIVERYLLDDLWETDKVELTLNESNFLVSKMLPTTFTRACTMGTAGIWKMIMLAWSFENNLAIPATGVKKKFTGGLSRLLKTGYVDKIVKLDYNSLYPSVILTWNIENLVDSEDVLNSMLLYVLSQREKYKGLKAEAGAKADELKKMLNNVTDKEQKKLIKEEIQHWKAIKSSNDKKQLPLKILGNSYFGSAGSESLFPWGDNIAAEKTTCISRQLLRLMISHFNEIGYTPIVGDTDGFNFKMPDEFRYTESNPYIGKGLGRNVKEGVKYTKVEADVAEFEDVFLNKAYNKGINMSGLGIDEYCDACIQFARKNYADKMPDGSTKKVGNTIKSRKMAGYLERFIDSAIDMLLNGEGSKFIEAYYDYISRIYNYQIPIREVASKGKIKKTIAEYKRDCQTLTKAGNKKSRQAWYELAIREGLNVNVSDTIYYVNTGTKKGHSDVKKVTHQYVIDKDGNEVEFVGKVKSEIFKSEFANYNVSAIKQLTKEMKSEIIKKHVIREEEEIILNCQLVPNEIVDSERDILCSEVEGLEYNAEKYIEQFNNRIKPLLVCFSPEIRNRILITNPENRQFFTEEEARLVAGYPNNEGDQDTYEALMTPERKEISFWLSINERPPFVDECHIAWDDLVSEHLKQLEEENNELFKQEDEKYLKALNELTYEDYQMFESEGQIPLSLLDIVTLNTDMRFYFKKIPDKTPSTGGYIFDDLEYDKIETKSDDVGYDE